MSEIYVVGVSHNTEQGEVVADTVLLTKSIRVALRVARNIKDLGYECFSFETGVTIRRLGLNHPYRKIDPKQIVGGKLPRKYVFSRRHVANHAPHECAPSHWEETWFDKTLQGLHDEENAPLN
ncbi:MAG: hypothetical protein HYY92_01770 [Parcubacteria group bacterium]|nr:hypothetical protein [Parcubacteria group bacterium]